MEKKLILAKKNKFKVVFNRIPLLNELLDSVTIPEFSPGLTTIPYQGSSINIPGSAIKFGDLNISLKVDEDHTIIEDIMKWIMESTNDDSFPGRAKLDAKDSKVDLLVEIETNSQNATASYNFVGVIPVSLSMDALNRGDSDELKAQLTLNYDYFKINDISNKK